MSEPIYNPHETETSIELGPGNLMRQAVMTAHDYMMYARSNINELFGNGYAEKHPELIAAFMQTAALDFGTAILAQQIRKGLDDIGRYGNGESDIEHAAETIREEMEKWRKGLC